MNIKDKQSKQPISFLSSYAFFWEREAVIWGRSYETGKLLGKANRNKNTKLKDTIAFSKQVGLYALYDDDHSLVYFGQVGTGKYRSLYTRINEHCTDHLARRWSQFSWFGITGVNKNNELRSPKSSCQGPAKAFLDQLEAAVIAISNPPSNRKSGSFKGAVQYYQFRDPSLDPTVADKIDIIYKKLVV